MTAQDDYQSALTTISGMEADSARRVDGYPAKGSVTSAFARYGNSVANPMIDDLSSGRWKDMPAWQLGGMIDYLAAYGTSKAVSVLREIEKDYPVSDVQQQAKKTADDLATLDVAVSEARKLDFVQTALSSGDANAIAKAGLLALSKIDPDWNNRASEIQILMSQLSRDSFPAVNEISDGKVNSEDLMKALGALLFEDEQEDLKS